MRVQSIMRLLMDSVFIFCFIFLVIAQAIPLRTEGELRVDGALEGRSTDGLCFFSFVEDSQCFILKMLSW